MPKSDLAAARLREVLRYDPATGTFTWLKLSAGRNHVGGVAGRLTNTGLRQIHVDGVAYTARKLAWLYVFGEWPKSQLKPINGLPDDLRIDNIRILNQAPDTIDGLTAEQLRSLVRYEPETGQFIWIVDLGGDRAAGGIAPTGAPGWYRTISLRERMYRTNRLAVLYMTGAWPCGVVDHINGVKDDDRWVNLRDVTPSVNAQNQRAAHRNSKSGVLGVHWRPDRQKWQTTIKGEEKRKHVGYFDTAEEGGRAYVEAKRQLHEGCTL